MKRICIHWAGGVNTPNEIELNHYHYLIDVYGRVYSGKFKPEANIKCVKDKYAEHCGGGNTNTIGIALCGMNGFIDRNNIGKFPLTKIQCETSFQLIAILCKKYDIKVTPKTIYTHYEFGIQNPKTTSAGKIDIIFLPPYSHVLKDDIGNFIRSKIKWYLNK